MRPERGREGVGAPFVDIMELSRIADYDVGQLIGSGGFATVYRAIARDTSDEVAIKIMDKQHLREMKMTKRVRAEIAISLQLHHPHVVQSYCSFQDDNNIYLVMELCENGNLYRYIKRNGPIREFDAARIIYQLLSALHYLHQKHIIHRDLKLSNVLFDHEMNVKLCDFGLAVQLEHPDEEHYTICGTPNYIAPEIASQQAHSVPADVWSLGCIFYCMVAGRAPFEREDIRETLQRVVNGEFAIPEELSPTGKEFLQCLLHRNPKVRSSTAHLLQHVYLQPYSTSSSPIISRSIEKLKLEDSPLRWSCSSLASISSRHSLGSPVSRDTAIVELEDEAISKEQRTELLHTPVSHPRARITSTLTPAASSTATPPELKQSAEPEIRSRTSRTKAQRDEHCHERSGIDHSFHIHRLQTTPSTSLQSSSSYYSLLRSLHLEQSSTASLRSSTTQSSIPTLWKMDQHIPEFCYITPKQNLFLHCSSSMNYFVQLKTRQGLRYHRLCVLKSSPLQLLVSPCSPAMLDELQNLSQVTPTQNSVETSAINASGQLLPPLPTSSALLSSCPVVKYAITNLPAALRRHYQFVTTLLTLLPSKLPKLTLYLRNHTSDNAVGQAPMIFCKCILMSNLPLPDFLVRFTNAIKIHYALESGHLTISQPGKHGPSLILYESDMKSMSNWCEHAPEEYHQYILTSQKAMQMCLVLSGQQSSADRVIMGSINNKGAIVLDDDR